MKRILVIGAGYGGMRTVKKLAGAGLDAEIVLVNKNPYHYQTTQLHEVAAGTKEPSDITFDIAQAFANKKNVHVIIDEVTKVDQDAKRVELKNSDPIGYDYLVNSLGFESETFGIPGVKENGWPVVDINTALAARKHLEDTLKRYKTSHDENDLHIVVCGAGFTSIEYLGELVHRMPKMAKEYGFPENLVKVECVEAGPKILGMFNQDLAGWAVKYLEKKGVTFHVSSPITEVRPDAVVSHDTVFPANTIIWTAGVHGSHVIADSGYDQKRNRVVVTDDLRVNGRPDQFLIGDVSGVNNPGNGRLFPTTAQISIAQADCAAKNIVALLRGQPTEKFVFKALGTVCSLGPTAGVASIDFFGHWNLRGWLAAIAKKLVADRAVFELTNIRTMLESD